MTDKMKKRGRPYGLGERNPKTLPDGTRETETFEENAAGTRRWKRLGKLAAGPAWTGAKY